MTDVKSTKGQLCLNQSQHPVGYPYSPRTNGEYGFPLDLRRSHLTMSPDGPYRHPERRQKELSLCGIDADSLMRTGTSELWFSTTQTRSKRTFVPDGEKDVAYWKKRVKNNTAAKRSRAKRKMVQLSMEIQLMKLQEENVSLKRELAKLRSCIPNLNAPRDAVGRIHEANLSPGKEKCDENVTASPDKRQQCTGDTYNDFYFHGVDVDNTNTPQIDLCRQFPLDLSPTSTLLPELSRSPLLWQSSPSPSGEDGYKLTKVPHKFRLKLTSHSAFCQ